MVDLADQCLSKRLPAIISVTAASFLLPMDAMMPSVALPTIAQELGVSKADAVLLVSLYNLMMAMLLLPFAALAERIGLRRMLFGGMAVYTVAALACTMANSFNVLLILRAMQAVGAAATLSVTIALVRSLYPPHQLGRGLGINTIAGSIGAAVALQLGGFIVQVAPWQAVFVAGTPLAILSLATGRFLPHVELRTEKFDMVGAILCAATFGLIIGGLQSVSQGQESWAVAILLAGALVAFVFVRHELGSSRPLLPLDLLAQPKLALSVAGGFTAVVASILMLLALPFLLTDLGLKPAEIGAMITPYVITTMVVAPACGMLSDRFSPGTLGTIGMVFTVAGLVSLTMISTEPTYLAMAWRMVLCGLGFGMFFAPNARLVVGSVKFDRAAAASSLLATMRPAGQALGATLLGILFSMHFKGAGPALFIAIGFAVFALLCSIARQFIRSADPG